MATAGATSGQLPPPNGAAGAPPNAGPQQTTGTQNPADMPPKPETPVYKKWWFWAVVAVSAYVVYEIASNDSSSQTTRARETLPLNTPGAGMATGGATLFRW